MLKTVDDIGRVVQNAVLFNPRNWRRGMENFTAHSPIETVRRLFSILRERDINYALVGGVALLYYIEGRNTQDLDLIIAVNDLSKLPEVVVMEQNVYFVRGQFEGVQIDFLLTSNPLFQRVQKEFVKCLHFLGEEVCLGTIEGLLLLKLYALPSLYRQGDFKRVGLYENDIAALVYEYEPDMERLLDIVGEYVGEGDKIALEEIVREIEERVKRFKSRG